jgi:magnesium transporter
VKSALTEQTGELVALLREGRLATVVHRAAQLQPADIADVLTELGASERRALVEQLPPELAASALRKLRARASMVAGGLMTSGLVSVSESDPIGLAVEAVRRQAAAIGDLTEVFVVDAERRLRGVLSIKQLLLASPTDVIRDVMSRNTVHVTPDEDQQSIARVILRYNLTSVPVVDGAGRLLGRVTADDVGSVALDDAAGELLRFGGVSVREAVDARWRAAVRSRLPWLYTNLLPAFGAAAVVYFFKGSLLRIVTLAVWMPVVAGVGGNAGTQALAASVRRLILQSGSTPNLGAMIAREAATGIVNGIGIGAVVGAVSVLVGESWKLGLVVSIAMMANLALAAVAGAAIPVVLKRLGRDPALASPVLLTALTDATGFAILLGLASVILL